MPPETKQCQNCQASFTIEPEDFAFYQKVKVPPPTFCPQCRFQRRLSWWNMTKLYRRKCDLCKKEGISTFHPDAPYTVYCPVCWWSDDWDPSEYAMDYDFSRPFFEQFNELLHKAPLLALSLNQDTAKLAPYNNHASELKNCYMLFHAEEDEDCYYGFFVMKSHKAVDSSVIGHQDHCYDMMHSWKNNRCIGARRQLAESINCVFMRDSINCQDCFGCANLYKKQYYIFNEPHSKEEYEKKIQELDLGSYKNYRELQQKAEDFWKTQTPKSDYNLYNQDSTGYNVFYSKNVKEGIEVIGAEDAKWLFMTWDNTKDCYDISSWGDNLTLSYESGIVGDNSSEIMFCEESGHHMTDARYSKLSTGTAAHHFGCVAAKKKNYCILNKEYSKEEYEEMIPKIIQHMNDMPYTDQKGNVYKYGEFFPTELSPFAYNETFANHFFPLKKEEVERRGYRWREPEKSEHQITKQSEDLPDHIKDAGDDITKEVIGCAKCGRGYRVLKAELDLLKELNVPLPRNCPLCRVEEKMNIWVKNVTTHDRNCSECSTLFKSSFTEDEEPKVLCKKCYQNAFI